MRAAPWLLALVAACAPERAAAPPPGASAVPWSARPAAAWAPQPAVPLYDAHAIGRPAQVIGIIDAHAPAGRTEEALAALRARAIATGADAVLGVEFHHGEDGQPGHVSGVAVRYRDLIGGRPYDVLSPLEARAPMGREDQAHEALRRQAGALGADLILDVQLHHGEPAGGEVRITGMAIRFR